MSIPRTWVIRYGVAVLAVFAAFGVKLLLEPLIQEGSSFLLFSLAVLVGALFGGLGPGILATLIAAVVGDYFFLKPLYTLAPPSFEHGLRTGFFALQGFAISGIGAALMAARQRTEQALEKSQKAEENYRGIFENAVDGIFRTAGDGRIVAANPAMARMLGYDSPDEVIAGGAMTEQFYADLSEREKFLYLMRENGIVRDFETRLRHRDGGEVWTSISARAVRDGGETAFEGIIEDITARKRVEDELRLRDRAISESANGIVITDASRPDNPIVYANPAFERITGYAAEEVLSHNCRFLQGPDRYQPPLEDLREAIREERSCTVILRNYKKDGTPFWNELSVSPVHDVEGDVTHFVGVQVDVTRRRRAEDELRRSEERMRQAADAAALGTWDYNLDSDRLVWDEKCREIHGLTPEAGVDHATFISRVHPEHRERVEAATDRALDPEGSGEYRAEYRTVGDDNGSVRWVDARGRAFFDESGQPVRMIGTVQDVTARKRDEGALRVLAAGSQVLATTLDYRVRLGRLADIVVPDLADWCSVSVIEEDDGSISQLAVAHRDPEKVAVARRLQERYPPDPDAPYGVPKVLRTGEPELIPEIPESLLEQAARDSGHREILDELGLKSYMVVPMIARGRTLGAITLVSAESGRRFDARDLELAETLVRRAALAVDNARIFENLQEEVVERRRVQEALKASEDRYRTFVEQSTEGIWRFEIEHPAPSDLPATSDLPEEEQLELFYQHAYLAECNDAMARMYGYSRAEELEGAWLGDMLPRSSPENVEYLRSFIRSGYRLNDTESLEPDRHGNPRFFLNNLTGIVEDGVLVRAWGTQRDITERKRAEEALRNSESSLAAAQRLSHLGNWAYDIARDEAEWSDELYRIFGFEPQSFTVNYKAFLKFVYPDDRNEVLAEVRRALSDSDSRSLDYRIVRQDGEVRVVHTEYEVTRDDSGRPTKMFGMVQDVTERRRAQQALEESEEQYRVVAETASDGIVLIDEDSQILFANSALGRIFGHSVEELVGEQLTVLMPEYLRHVHETSLRRYLDTGERHLSWDSIQLPGWHRDGYEIPLEVSFGEFVKEGRRFFSGFIRDITERKRAEEALRESEAKYRTLFDSIDEGFCTIEMIFDESGRPVDYRFLEVNAVFERQTGLAGAVGKRMLELSPHHEQYWFDIYGNVAVTGESVRFEERAEQLGRWFDVYASRVGGEESRNVVVVFNDITERKRAEEVRTRLATIVESSNDAIIAKTPDGMITDWNRGAERLYGYSAEEVVGKHITILTPPELSGEITRILETIRRGDRVQNLETVRVSKDGRRLNISLSVSPITDSEGNVVGASTIARDITDRKRAEEVLRQSEERFRATFEQAAVGAAHVGLDGSWLRVNQRLCEIIGYSREELLGTTFQDITHPDDLETDLEHLRQLLAGEIQRYSTEKRYFRKEGSVVWINLTVSLVRDASGEPDYFVSVVEDISDRKEAETRYQTLVEQLPAVTYIQSAERNTLTYLSPQFEEMIGYPPEEYLDDPELRARTTHPEDYEGVLAEDRLTDETGELFSVEYRRVRRDGEIIWVREEAVLVRDSEGRPLYWQGLLTDITERKETEKTLREVKEAEQVRIAQDLHDTVLQDMAYAVQEMNVRQIIAESRDEEDPQFEEIARILRRGIESLRAAVFEMRLQGETGRTFVESLELLVDLNRRMARRHYTIGMTVGHGFPDSISEAAKIEVTRIVQEALSNVRKHSGASHVHVSLWGEGDDLWVEVSDDGSGFDTGAFSAGLGASSMRARAERLGGELKVESEPGKGTRVRFRAPRERWLLEDRRA